MTAHTPPGWPPGVHPPGSEEFERSAVAWLLEVVPSDYLLHGVLRRHPIALATVARHHLDGCVEGARSAYRSVRTELGPHLPPAALEAVLAAYRSEGARLAATALSAGLIERALRGETFRPYLGGPEGDLPAAGTQAVRPATRQRSRDRAGPDRPPPRRQPPDRAT